MKIILRTFLERPGYDRLGAFVEEKIYASNLRLIYGDREFAKSLMLRNRDTGVEVELPIDLGAYRDCLRKVPDALRTNNLGLLRESVPAPAP